MQDLKQFFDYMNDVDFPYVVLRNWEGLPYNVEVGEHSDLDILVYDLEHWKEIFPEAEEVYPYPRVQYKVPIGDSYIQVDVRHLTDGYYPLHFENLLLETRKKHDNGFYVPNDKLHVLALAYHAVHHKDQNAYQKWLGDASVKELLSALQESDIGWVEPSDSSVGRFNSYLKGATSTVEKGEGKVIKKQTKYEHYDLIANETRLLKECSSEHFPTLLGGSEDSIHIEDCGDPITIDNLPDNWRQQLIDIMEDLAKHKVEHRDIKPDNLMVKDGVIKLIDFGWARLKSDPKDNPPSCLGHPYRASWGPDDNFAMKQVIKELEYNSENIRV